MRDIDRDYAELSLKTGMFAGAADSYLGGTMFMIRGRQHRWDLTWEKLAAWQQEAIALGVPAAHLNLSAEEQAELEHNIDIGIALQREIDQAIERKV